jgi:hypothetical protein
MQGEIEEPGSKHNILTAEEIEQCLLAITDTQHRAIFILTTELGFTNIELLGDEELDIRGLYIQDIDSRNMTLKITARFKKEDRCRTRLVPMNNPSMLALKDYLASKNLTFDDKGKVFDITDRMVRYFLSGLETKTGIKKSIDMATLRRTAIIKMLRGGLRPDEIERRMGFLRGQEKSILVISTYFVPDLNDYERLFKGFLVENAGAMSQVARASK